MIHRKVGLAAGLIGIYYGETKGGPGCGGRHSKPIRSLPPALQIKT